MDKDKLITRIRASSSISWQKAGEIASHFNDIIFAKNEFLLKAGSVCNKYVFLEEGFLRSYTYHADGYEVTTGFHWDNQFVFEQASFFQRSQSKENIVALANCKGCFITYDQLQSLFHEMPEFREFGRGILVEVLVMLKQKTLSMINETAEERYKNLLKHQPELTLLFQGKKHALPVLQFS